MTCFQNIEIRLLVLLMIAIIPIQAQDNDLTRLDPVEFSRVGLSGWQFLHLPTTARNAALGGIKCGLTRNDASAIFTNPAKLVDIKNMDAAFTRINYVAEISFITVSFVKNFGSWGVFGLSVANLNAGDMIRTENLLTGGRSGDLGTFEAGDILAGISYARQITDRLSLGGNISYIEETLDDVKAKNWDLDFGVSFKTGFRSLRFDVIIRNFGPDTRFVGFSEQYGDPASVRMPLDYYMGVGFDFMGGNENDTHTLSGFLELVHPNDNEERLHTAVEYMFSEFFHLRSGYKFNYNEQGLTAGVGLNVDVMGVLARLDYAYLDYGRLKNVQMITMGFKF
ncbi:PorV/PorQ family protein [bacterium]